MYDLLYIATLNYFGANIFRSKIIIFSMYFIDQLASFVKGTRLEAVNQVNVNNVQVTPEESKQGTRMYF